MVLTPGDERRIQGMMLTGWMGKADLLKGWASEGKKKSQPPREAGGRGAGERARFKHLKVKTEGRVLRITALFDRNVPDTSIGVRGSNDTRSEGWQSQSPGDHRGREEGDQSRLVQRASAGCRWAHQAVKGEWCGEHGPHQGWKEERRGLRRPPRRGRGVHPGVGVRRLDHRLRQHGLRARGHPRLAWMARGRLPYEGHGNPRDLRQGGAERTQREELRGCAC